MGAREKAVRLVSYIRRLKDFAIVDYIDGQITGESLCGAKILTISSIRGIVTSLSVAASVIWEIRG
jgi:hypothetical protein